MKSMLFAALLGLFVVTLPPALPGSGGGVAYAQQRFNLDQAIQRLKSNPKYRGRVLGTRVVNAAAGKLVEVRILRPDDRIIIVYIDPETGGVVADSGS